MKVLLKEVLGFHFLIPMDDDLDLKPVELNQTAFEMYQLFVEGKSTEQVTDILSAQYQIPTAELHSDVVSCYDSLHSKGII